MAQGSLFDDEANKRRQKVAPLASRMRPQSLDEFVGQSEVLGPQAWLRRVIDADALSSVILYGPAGTGKTSLARIIANQTRAQFDEVSAVSGSVADLRTSIQAASNRLAINGTRTILFIDEIHRFSKSQQDALLHAVEDRVLVLIGATTENPYFEVNSALVSRSRIIELQPLSDEDIVILLERALASSQGLDERYEASLEVLKAIAVMSGGDARVALTTLELAAQLASFEHSPAPDQKIVITKEAVADVIPSRQLPYDKAGDTHYDVISAFIKSMRGSDPDAAVYWLARMLHGGEDPKFIARRMMIFASEDVGNADPFAFTLAHAAFRAAEVIGMPECRINLSQAAIYLALAAKSNASYLAIDAALEQVRRGSTEHVPNHLRDRHRPGSEEYGPYRYPHDFKNHWVAQQYLPDGLLGHTFYKPGEIGWEHKAAERLRGYQQDT